MVEYDNIGSDILSALMKTRKKAAEKERPCMGSKLTLFNLTQEEEEVKI